MDPRFVERRVREVLKDTRVTLISAPRQAGKTTLAQSRSTDGMPFFTLDDQTTTRASGPWASDM